MQPSAIRRATADPHLTLVPGPDRESNLEPNCQTFLALYFWKSITELRWLRQYNIFVIYFNHKTQLFTHPAPQRAPSWVAYSWLLSCNFAPGLKDFTKHVAIFLAICCFCLFSVCLHAVISLFPKLIFLHMWYFYCLFCHIFPMGPYHRVHWCSFTVVFSMPPRKWKVPFLLHALWFLCHLFFVLANTRKI